MNDTHEEKLWYGDDQASGVVANQLRSGNRSTAGPSFQFLRQLKTAALPTFAEFSEGVRKYNY
jgi:hypothetical protein